MAIPKRERQRRNKSGEEDGNARARRWRNHKTLIHSQGTSQPLVFGCQSDNMLITVAAIVGRWVASHNLYLHDGEGMTKQEEEEEEEEEEEGGEKQRKKKGGAESEKRNETEAGKRATR